MLRVTRRFVVDSYVKTCKFGLFDAEHTKDTCFNQRRTIKQSQERLQSLQKTPTKTLSSIASSGTMSSSTIPPHSDLLDLPPETLLNVLSSSSVNDLIRIRATSKSMRDFIDANQHRLLNPIITKHQARLTREYIALIDTPKLAIGDAFLVWFDHYGPIRDLPLHYTVRKLCAHWVDQRGRYVNLLPIMRYMLRQWLVERITAKWEFASFTGFKETWSGYFQQWLTNWQPVFTAVGTWCGDATIGSTPQTLINFYKDHCAMPVQPQCRIPLHQNGSPLYIYDGGLREDDLGYVGLSALVNVSGMFYSDCDIRVCVRYNRYIKPVETFGWTSPQDVTLLQKAAILEDAFVF